MIERVFVAIPPAAAARRKQHKHVPAELCGGDPKVLA
jgi:hypothetical protein